MTLTSLSNEELTIQVPNKFHFEWLESKYRHLIDEAIAKGKKIGVFPIDEDAWIDVGQWSEYKKVIEKL